MLTHREFSLCFHFHGLRRLANRKTCSHTRQCTPPLVPRHVRAGARACTRTDHSPRSENDGKNDVKSHSESFATNVDQSVNTPEARARVCARVHARIPPKTAGNVKVRQRGGAKLQNALCNLKRLFFLTDPGLPLSKTHNMARFGGIYSQKAIVQSQTSFFFQISWCLPPS